MGIKTKIFVVYHLPETTVYSDVYQPICVGEDKDEFNQFYLRDDVGDNIAEQNFVYNELTAIYWVYKHINDFKEYDYIGFCHYRRFFAFNGDNTAYVRKFVNHSLIDISQKQMENYFKEYDFIAPLPSHYKSVRNHYEKSHNRKDIKILLEIIKEKFPEYYDDAIQYFDGRDEYLYNSFVFSKECFIEYSDFMFSLVNEFCLAKKEKNIRLYVSERITGVYIKHLLNKGKKGLYFPILHVRRKLIFQCIKQSFHNIWHSKDRSILIRIKPILLCFMPRHVEERIRRKKAK